MRAKNADTHNIKTGNRMSGIFADRLIFACAKAVKNYSAERSVLVLSNCPLSNSSLCQLRTCFDVSNVCLINSVMMPLDSCDRVGVIRKGWISSCPLDRDRHLDGIASPRPIEQNIPVVVHERSMCTTAGDNGLSRSRTDMLDISGRPSPRPAHNSILHDIQR